MPKHAHPLVSSCGACYGPDNDKMVQCDKCDVWFHYECVQVSDDVAERDWMCYKCTAAKKGTQKGTATAKTSSASGIEKFQSPSTSHPAKVKQDKAMSKCSSNKSKRKLELELQLLEEEKQLNITYLQKKYELIHMHEGSDESDDEDVDKQNDRAVERTQEWVAVVSKGNGGSGVAAVTRDAQCSRNNHRSPLKASPELIHQTLPVLPASALNARQVISPELPTFSGRAEEWPMFISSFENSTRLCAFSDDENMLRLQRALRGRALEYVSSRLMIPALVPEVISTLKMVFGRPEAIIASLLAKLRASPNVNANKLESLINFALEVRNLTATMTAAKLQAHLNNPLLLQELIDKMPAQMKLNWAVFSRSIQGANLEEFSNWLFEIAEAASDVVSVNPLSSAPLDNERRKGQRIGFHEEKSQSELRKSTVLNSRCAICEQPHFLTGCSDFKSMSYNEKWNVVRDNGLCRTCLKEHDLNYCPDRKECGVNGCKAKHHPLLHKSDKGKNDTRSEVLAIHRMQTSNVLFKIIPVTIYGKNSSVDVYAFLDDGSGPTLIEQNILQKLQMQGTKRELCLKWTDGSTRVEQDSEQLDLQISARGNAKRFLLRDVYSVDQLDLPSQTLVASELSASFKHLKGLPVESYRNATPKIIIGLNNRNVAMPIKFREGKASEPAATKTRLGWTIFGVLHHPSTKDIRNTNTHVQLHICECDNNVALQKLMTNSMAMDEPICKADYEASAKNKDHEALQKSVLKNDHKFVAKLLWKNDNVELPDNFEMAFRRLLCFERKLNKDPLVKEYVNKHIEDMEAKGYVRKIKSNEITAEHPRKWYLPIFVVRNANKPSKIRLVWDAAATYRGISLNGSLNQGPDLLTSLREVLLNFRIGKVGICADIREMFHRVAIHEEDQQSQRFLWRKANPQQEPDVYVLQVMSFGASCSPSIAQYAKNRNARDHEKEYPRAAKSILERHYVDDMLDSVNSVEEAIHLAKDVKKIHKRRNFHIRNWLSNAPEVQKAMGEEGSTEQFCHAGKSVDYVIEPENVLGMWWHTVSDRFTFSVKFTKASADILRCKRVPTKREVLRLLMSIFDPLGFLSFFTISIKILLQHIWRSGIAWDESISDEHAEVWEKWICLLYKIQDVQIPRCYFTMGSSNECKLQIHIMVDASEDAYAAVVYLRIEYTQGVELSFVCSKTKVAPLKPLSIPRMELLAAVMGARLGESVNKALDLNIASTHYWTDSKTVLKWLRNDPRAYKQFVMFRIGKIQETTNVEHWHHVPSKQNAADLATKWNRQPNFDSEGTWFTGPIFLYSPPNEWPNLQERGNEDVSELKQTNTARYCAVHAQRESRLFNFTRFSKWERLLRCTAYVLRFISRLKAKVERDSLLSKRVEAEEPGLTSTELSHGEQLLFRLAQAETFNHDIQLLKQSPTCTLPKTSLIKKLSPFLDKNGVVRMRGRLVNATMIDDAVKYPIILPKTHHVTWLFIDWYHRSLKHVNHETVINEIFQRFHIGSLRKILRSTRYKCQTCKNLKAKPAPPEMAPLPEARLTAFTRPFTFVGVDFFGPLIVSMGRRTEKRYGVVFTCLTCRAIHLEVAYSLSMDSCIMAVRNFIARRGSPRQFYSDNGTNLRACEKELREAFQQLDLGALQAEFTTPEMRWTFIPSASPHMGGAWERMVRSIKTVMYKMISPDTKLSDEKLQNLLTEIESIINRRPLTYLSLETAEQEALTPNHFLLRSSSGDKPPGKLTNTDQYVKSSWRHSQLLADKFWKRWVCEFLPTLAQRTTWFNKEKPIEVGDVTIIVDPNSPRNCWPKGIITKVITGTDGQVRSAVVRTNSGEYHRPAAKLAILDVRCKSTGSSQ